MQELPQTFTGVVIEGYKKARDFGTPSANIPMGDRELIEGNYYGTTTVDGRAYPSLIYYGGPRKNLGGMHVLETHLINQSIDLYGKEITVEVNRFVRPNIKPIPLDKLAELIKNDLQAAKKEFNV